jgi:hypothetical protein
MKKQKNKIHFCDEGVRNIVTLASILKRIHVRLMSEGYTFKDGILTKPNGEACKNESINGIKKMKHDTKE